MVYKLIAIIKTYFFFGLRTILPLIMLPFLSHRLGANGLGVVLAGQSLGLLGAIIIQYGFHQSASREIGVTTNDRDLDLVVSKVLSAQVFTSAAAVILILIFSLATPSLSSGMITPIGAIMVALGAGLSPAWYFRGTGRSAMGMAFDFVGQLFSLILLLLLVNDSNSINGALVILGLGPMIGSAMGIGTMLCERSSFHFQKISSIMHQLYHGCNLFISRLTSTGFTLGATWLVSLLTNPTEVAYFGVAAKLVGALGTLSQPVLFVLLPRMSKNAELNKIGMIKSAAKWGLALILIALSSVLLLQISATYIIGALFADDMSGSVEVTKFLSYICIVSAVRDAISDLMLIPLRKDLNVALSVLGGGITMVLSSLILAPSFGALGMASARIFGDFIAVIILLFFLTLAIKDDPKNSISKKNSI